MTPVAAVRPGFLRRLACLLAVGMALVATAFASDKKGIGIWEIDAAEKVDALKVAWYYTWRPMPMSRDVQATFVPMMSGKFDYQRQIATLRSRGPVPTLLVINEPDQTAQANMSVDEVARLWPELEPLAAKLSSPATAGQPSAWFERFHRVAKSRGLKVDFMAIHLYGPPNPKRFLDRIDEAYRKYDLPIWITEFAVADWDAKGKPTGTNRYSEEKVLEFMKVVLPELEKRPYVLRYAWFGARKSYQDFEQTRTSRLFESNGSLTPLGRYYADFSAEHKR
ncbi:glycosyl hydrolase [Sulfurisoma sediminicola]|uniref:Putative glycosyl hydrolase n=1 Tax=Sulfurisoma sediminicola TaxID=1381557 RepID=A0A497XMZ9_9PROT|nr:glycosyl hydrolase [Sulfurisoma sediminicola]RLJ67609.1 putative glycosyl hydrolase [Sulfurisoma sediminicola]